MGYRVGENAGPYAVLRFLGRGNFGEVFLAKDPRTPHRCVALKTITCDQLSGESADSSRKAALSEAKILRRLRHPHIVGCEDVEWDAKRETVWLALEFMDGGDVQSLLDARRQEGGPRFENHFIRRVLAAVGSALQYIHGEGILHRDVKPANVLLTRRSRRIKLGDFGIAKLLEATSRARTLVGTPYYLSPEIVSGQAYSAPVDAWALGVCLYELAALRRPFEAANPLALVRRICEENPAPLPPDVAEDIARAVLGLLVRDQGMRMGIAEALAVSDEVSLLVGAGDYSPRGYVSHMMSDEDESADEIELSPVHAVSDAECGSSTDDNDFEASFLRSRNTGHFDFSIASRVAERRVPSAVLQARNALSADVDDPEELREALAAVEQEAERIGSRHDEELHALVHELRLRIEAVRADAAALLQSLIDGTGMTNLPDNGSAGLSISIPLEGKSSAMATLETAIEVATSWGLDTCPAEAKAASVRGLLSLRVYWGSMVKCCMLRLGASFLEVVVEVTRRFGIVREGEQNCAPSLEFMCRERGETIVVRDQNSWEYCLRRCGLLSRPGRLELHVETPFMVLGTACPTPNLKGRVGAQAALGPAHVPLSVSPRPATPSTRRSACCMDAERLFRQNRPGSVGRRVRISGPRQSTPSKLDALRVSGAPIAVGRWR